MSKSYSSYVQTAIGAAVVNGNYPNNEDKPLLAPDDSIYTNGSSGANKIDGEAFPLVAATTGGVSINLHNGTLKTEQGDSIVAARVVTLAFFSPVDNTAAVTITGNFITTRFGASAAIPLGVGARVVIDVPDATGLVVVASTGEVITFTAASGTQNVQCAITTRST